jgi:hypothetical protein
MTVAGSNTYPLFCEFMQGRVVAGTNSMRPSSMASFVGVEILFTNTIKFWGKIRVQLPTMEGIFVEALPMFT